MSIDDDSPEISSGYPIAQLLKALAGTNERATARVERWKRVLAGMADGTLRIGSRTPVSGTPAWVTLEVVHGGFATGSHAAGGDLRPHEVAQLAHLDRAAGANGRAVLNHYFLTNDGHRELLARLADGRYRVRVPEEGALLAIAWLLAAGETKRATGIVDAIAPFFDRLRFYPVPHERPARTGTAVSIQTADESAARLRAVRAQPHVERMNESLRVWLPLTDRIVALWSETVDGDQPALARTADGALARSANGQPIVTGGWPCRHYPDDWGARASALHEDIRAARASNPLCGRPDAPKSVLARLRGHLETCVRDPRALTGRDVGAIRGLLAAHSTRHGAPGSARLIATRSQQARDAARPMHHAIASVIAARLDEHAGDEGVPDLSTVLAPITPDESERSPVPAGYPLPESLIAWRQMMFYLSFLDDDGIAAHLEWSSTHLTEQAAAFQQRFEPAIVGLRVAAAGERFGSDGIHARSGGRRFLGWSIERHWLRPSESIVQEK